MISRLISNMISAFQNELCFLSKPSPIGKKLEHRGFRVYYLPLTHPWVILIVVFHLYRLLRGNQYDILHLYDPKANLLGQILEKLSGHKRMIRKLRSKYPSGTPKVWTFYLISQYLKLSLGYESNSRAAIYFLAVYGYDNYLLRWL